MDWIFAAGLGMAGLITGFLIPQISDRIVLYKCENKDIDIKVGYFSSSLYKVVLGVLNAAAWTSVGVFMEDNFAAFLLSLLLTIALLFAIIDIRINLIPNELLVVAFILGGIFQIIHFGIKDFLMALVCMVAMMAVFIIAGFIVGTGKVGAGDVKLAGIMGVTLGYPNIMTAVLVMSLALGLYSIIGIGFRRLTLSSMLPFAPFMMLGMTVSLASLLWLG